MIPAILKPFEADILANSRPCVRITATSLRGSETLSVSASRFGGLPYLPPGVDYPAGKTGAPMVHVAQINFAECPPLPGFPDSGILQLFLESDGGWYSHSGPDLILFHPESSLPPESRRRAVTGINPLERSSPIRREHRLSFASGVDYGGWCDSQFGLVIEGLPARAWLESHLEEEENDAAWEFLSGDGHKLGGYALFAGDDPRERYPSIRHHIQLLQISQDYEIDWGRYGSGHIFISRDDLEKEDFAQALFYRDSI